MWPCIVTNFLIIKPSRYTNFSNLCFGNETLHVSDSSSVHHQELFTYTQQCYVIQVCRQISSRNCISILVLLLESCLQTCMKYSIAEYTVNNSWWWTEELSETCRVSFPKYKFEKLVHLVGFIIRKHNSVCPWLLCFLKEKIGNITVAYKNFESCLNIFVYEYHPRCVKRVC
jgi:hypothetical protein